MPLPDASTQWPPANQKDAYESYVVNDAWYTGNIEALETIYATTQTMRNTGIWGQVRRMFWGTPNPGNQAQRPNKLHVPVASEIARMSSQLLFSEMPNVELEEGAEQQQARLMDLLDDNLHARLLEAGELAAAHGGAFLRVNWDTTVVPDKPFITALGADAAVPEFRWGRLTAVTFWTDLPAVEDQDGIWRLLERHEPGSIEFGLYHAKTQKELGMRLPLGDHPSTVHLAGIVDADSSVETGTTLLTAVYLPNVAPNRKGRKNPDTAYLGRSDYDGVDALFDALDETYTSWMRDIRLGKARVLIDRQMMDIGAPGNGATFNADQEVFTNFTGTSVGSLAGAQQMPIEQVQFAIRVNEHLATVQHLLERIFASCGYSPQTFGEASGLNPRTITATEVDSREKLTMLTRASKIMYAKPQLQALLGALLDVDAFVFNKPGRKDGELPRVEFPDAAAPSMDALAQTLQFLKAAGAVSTQTSVEMLHPDWSDQQVEEEVARILGEQPAPLADPLGGSLPLDAGNDINPDSTDAGDGPGDPGAAPQGSAL